MRLFTMPGTCALAPNIVSRWVRPDIEIVTLARGDHRKPAYLEINPKGQVPALEIGAGNVLTEAAAILDYVASLGSRDDLRLDGDEGRARVLEALSYMTSEVHADYGGHFSPERFAETEDAREQVKSATYAKLARHYERLEETLKAAGGDWYLGRRTIADPYLYVLWRWIGATPLDPSPYPTLGAFARKMREDEGVVEALTLQKMI